ncbi:MAG: hypothetical protein AB1486_33005 [Planctomycetota bacterium]
MNPLLERIRTEGATLLKAGFQMGDEHFSPADFGNAYVVLERGCTRIRVVRERGQEFVELASSVEPALWFDADIVLQFLGTPGAGGSLRGLPYLSPLLAREASRIEEAFTPPHFAVTRDRLNDLLARRQAGAKKPWKSN